jgi:hypothetical protein
VLSLQGEWEDMLVAGRPAACLIVRARRTTYKTLAASIQAPADAPARRRRSCSCVGPLLISCGMKLRFSTAREPLAKRTRSHESATPAPKPQPLPKASKPGAPAPMPPAVAPSPTTPTPPAPRKPSGPWNDGWDLFGGDELSVTVAPESAIGFCSKVLATETF